MHTDKHVHEDRQAWTDMNTDMYAHGHAYTQIHIHAYGHTWTWTHI